MGYKAWVGGKSAWVSTKFGTGHNMQEHDTTSGPGNKPSVKEPHEYYFRTPDGDIIHSPSFDLAKNMAGEGAVLISAPESKKRKH